MNANPYQTSVAEPAEIIRAKQGARISIVMTAILCVAVGLIAGFAVGYFLGLSEAITEQAKDHNDHFVERLNQNR